MKNGIFALATLTSFNCLAMDYLGAMYNPDKGTLYGTTTYVMGSTEYDRENENTNSKSSREYSYSDISQRVEVGLGNSLVAIGYLNYTVDEEFKAGSYSENSSGLQALAFGARYRLSDKVTLPFPLDVGIMFKPSFNDKELANSNDDGTANSGGHDIAFSARAGSDKLYFKTFLKYYLEQTAINATNNDPEYTTDPYFSMGATLGSQFSPMEKLLLDGSAHISRTGEIVTNYDSGGDSTLEPNIAIAFELQSYYEFYKNISANFGLKYTIYQDRETETDTNTYTNIDKTLTNIYLGASYRY